MSNAGSDDVGAPMQEVGFTRPGAPQSAQLLSKADVVADALRERILYGLYRPGEAIHEAPLQAEFGVSNAPVRSALQRLAAEGVVTRSPQHGARVVELSEGELIQRFELRVALVETAAQFAAYRASSAMLQEVDARRTSLDAAFAGMKSGHFELMNGQLMSWLFRASGNRHLLDMWNRTQHVERVYTYESLRRTEAANSAPLQHRLVDVIEDRKVDAAREKARVFQRPGPRGPR